MSFESITVKFKQYGNDWVLDILNFIFIDFSFICRKSQNGNYRRWCFKLDTDHFDNIPASFCFFNLLQKEVISSKF